MRRFDIDALQIVQGCGRSGTQGYQPKYIVGDLYIKQQCSISAQLRDDYKVEVFASKTGDVLNIPVIKQESCLIVTQKGTRYGVVSKNLEVTEHVQFCSFKYLMERFGVFVDDMKLRHSNALDKLTYYSELYTKAINVPQIVAEKYMLSTAIIDIMVGNSDRHTRNFGAWLHCDGSYSLYPIFDNGLGFGQGVSDLRYCRTYNDFMRETYIAPYGEDLFELLQMLDKIYHIKQRLLRPHLNELSKLGKIGYPNAFAKEYYHNIINAIKEN